MENNSKNLVAKTLAGLETVLANELRKLGAENVQEQKRAVTFTGDQHLIYKSNLWCRTALSILKPVFSFRFETQQEYYDILRSYQWDQIFSIEKTMAINALAFDSVFTNTHFLAQRTKDAIVDYFVDKTGKRPTVDLDDPHIKLNIFISRDQCSVSLDSSGAPLFKRGYRRKNVAAPLNEVLGAGLIALSGWDTKQPLYDPMCGSATFSIEAGMMTLNMAPSIFRKSFSFMHWNDFEPDAWETLKEEAIQMQNKEGAEIFASDISNLSMDAARQNLMEAGLLGRVKLEKRDFFQLKPKHNEGIIIINPPYGLRMQNDNIGEYYKNIGAAFKHNFSGFRAYIISPDKQLTHKIGLRHTFQKMVFNGPLECRFMEYELYQGTRKEKGIDSESSVKPMRKRVDPPKKTSFDQKK